MFFSDTAYSRSPAVEDGRSSTSWRGRPTCSRTAPAATTLTAEDADVDAFDQMLDEIDSGWRHHVTNWEPLKGSPGTPSSKRTVFTGTTHPATGLERV
jgi:hypothetical protein